jgi:hypothetical protein
MVAEVVEIPACLFLAMETGNDAISWMSRRYWTVHLANLPFSSVTDHAANLIEILSNPNIGSHVQLDLTWRGKESGYHHRVSSLRASLTSGADLPGLKDT